MDLLVTFICICPFVLISLDSTTFAIISISLGYISAYWVGIVALRKAKTAKDRNLKYLINGVVGSMVFILTWPAFIIVGVYAYAWLYVIPIDLL